MVRRLSEQNRHFLTLKRRVDNLASSRGREEALQTLEFADDSIRVTDTASLTVSQAAATQIIDDFEDDDLVGWSQIGSGSASTVSSPTAQGTNFAAKLDASSTSIALVDDGDLPNIPSPGDEWVTYFYLDTADTRIRSGWGFQNEGSGDGYNIQAEDSNVIAAEVSRQGVYDITPFDKSTYAGQYVRTRIKWDSNGNHNITIEDPTDDSTITTIDFVDSQYTSGAVLIGAKNGVAYHDELEITASASSVSATAKTLVDRRWYPLNQGSGSTAYDVTGDRTASINGASWDTGGQKTPNTLRFDGTDDYVNLGTFDLDKSADFTVMFWLKGDVSEFTRPFGRENRNSDASIQMLTVDGGGTFRFNMGQIGGNAYNIDYTSYNMTNWNHVAGTFDSSGPSAALYVNGDEKGTASGALDSFGDSKANYLGAFNRSGDENHFDGLIDDFRVYDTRVSGSEISRISNDTI